MQPYGVPWENDAENMPAKRAKKGAEKRLEILLGILLGIPKAAKKGVKIPPLNAIFWLKNRAFMLINTPLFQCQKRNK